MISLTIPAIIAQSVMFTFKQPVLSTIDPTAGGQGGGDNILGEKANKQICKAAGKYREGAGIPASKAKSV